MTRNQISMYNFVYPKKMKSNTINKYSTIRTNCSTKLTNGNEAISKGHIDLNIPGGTKSIEPLCCTTKFVFIVPSKLGSAL